MEVIGVGRVRMGRPLDDCDAPRDSDTEGKRRSEEQAVVAVKLHLRQKIGSRNAEKRTCCQRQRCP